MGHPMTFTSGRADITHSAKHATLAVIEQLPSDASLDEITAAIWARSTAEPGGADACSIAASRLTATDPVALVLADRAARTAAILGKCWQIALDVVQALPEHALLDDVIVAAATWQWPDDATV
jgi:hypothetical protein